MDKNSFAATPPMGWNSYDYYDTSVNEAQIRANAEFMAEHLKDYGWEYVVIDIQWYANGAGTMRDQFQYIPFGDLETDAYGRLIPSPGRFPSSAGGKGFGPLADYVHSLGLKFGIHIMRGIPRQAAQSHCPVKGCDLTADMVADPSSICIWNPDMYGVRSTPAGQAYYNSIISMYAGWGVDFIKCDDICDSRLYRQEEFSGWEEIRMLHCAIEECGRPIVLSLSPGPAQIGRSWMYGKYANMWRITDDFWDDWSLLAAMFARCELWQDHVKKGCFPDCDMLPLGKLGKGFGQERETAFTLQEQKTMMTLWCMFHSPLMIGAELTKLDEQTLSLLTNRELLLLLKDGCRGEQVFRNRDEAVWVNRNENDGSVCVALFNLTDSARQISVTGMEAGLKTDPDTGLHELWSGENEKMQSGRITACVPGHGVKVYRVMM